MAEIKTVATDKAPAAIGPYSQAKVVNGFVFASGQIPINPATGAIEAKTIAEQADQACRNCGAILEAAGSDFDHVVARINFGNTF